MIRITALTGNGGKGLASVEITPDTADLALLPKGVRLNAQGRAYINFHANGVNGGANETGVKRVKALLKAVDKNGLGLVFTQPAFVQNEMNISMWGFGMAHLTRSGLEARIG